MIQEFVDIYMERKGEIESKLKEKHPDNYIDLVRMVVELLDDESYGSPSSKRIHTIDDGDYQGTLLYLIGANSYQPSTYWYVMISYGSCSGCDTLQSINGYSSEPPNESQVKDYMTLTLHIVQKFKKLEEDIV